VQGQQCGLSSSKTITTLTIQPNAGQAILNAPTTFAAGGFATFVMDGTGTWHITG
jgi:hypothetical protein